jgi:hypothetical protein
VRILDAETGVVLVEALPRARTSRRKSSSISRHGRGKRGVPRARRRANPYDGTRGWLPAASIRRSSRFRSARARSSPARSARHVDSRIASESAAGIAALAAIARSPLAEPVVRAAAARALTSASPSALGRRARRTDRRSRGPAELVDRSAMRSRATTRRSSASSWPEAWRSARAASRARCRGAREHGRRRVAATGSRRTGRKAPASAAHEGRRWRDAVVAKPCLPWSKERAVARRASPSLTADLPSEDAAARGGDRCRRKDYAPLRWRRTRGSQPLHEDTARSAISSGKGTVGGPQLDGISSVASSALIEDILDPSGTWTCSSSRRSSCSRSGETPPVLVRRVEGSTIVLRRHDRQGTADPAGGCRRAAAQPALDHARQFRRGDPGEDFATCSRTCSRRPNPRSVEPMPASAQAAGTSSRTVFETEFPNRA